MELNTGSKPVTRVKDNASRAGGGIDKERDGRVSTRYNHCGVFPDWNDGTEHAGSNIVALPN